MSTHSPARHFRNYVNLPFELFIAAFTLLPILVLIYFYPSLPESVPEYLNLRGEIEVWGRKGFASVFRLPLMAIDMQLLCLLMKYGLWRGKSVQRFEPERAEQASYREDSIKSQMNLWDWFRALITFKLGASSLEVIFLSIERFSFLATPVRIISWAAALLGMCVVVFYGYRLIKAERKLKETGGDDVEVSRRSDSAHLRGRILYYNPADPSLFNDRYLFNFANKWAYVFIGCVLCLPLLMFLPTLNA